jgi:uncharacterized protein
MNDAELDGLRTRVHAITRPEQGLLVLYVLTALAGLCLFPVIFVPLFFRYETLRYRFDDGGISVAYGILFKRELQLTYQRMQDIHLSQNILERWLGIGTVTVQTAGAGTGGEMTLVGVRDFEAIRDYLYARMRGVRGEDKKATVGLEQSLAAVREALEATTAALARLEKKG